MSDPTDVDIVTHCIDAQEFYRQKPGLHGPGTAIDLYYVCQELARRIDELEKKVGPLLEPVR